MNASIPLDSLVGHGFPLRTRVHQMGHSIQLMARIQVEAQQAQVRLAPQGFATTQAHLDPQRLRDVAECTAIQADFLQKVDTVDHYNDKVCVHFIFALARVQDLIEELWAFIDFKEHIQPGFVQGGWVVFGHSGTLEALRVMKASLEHEAAIYRASIGTDNKVLIEEGGEGGSQGPAPGSGQGPAQVI